MIYKQQQVEKKQMMLSDVIALDTPTRNYLRNALMAGLIKRYVMKAIELGLYDKIKSAYPNISEIEQTEKDFSIKHNESDRTFTHSLTMLYLKFPDKKLGQLAIDVINFEKFEFDNMNNLTNLKGLKDWSEKNEKKLNEHLIKNHDDPLNEFIFHCSYLIQLETKELRRD